MEFNDDLSMLTDSEFKAEFRRRFFNVDSIIVESLLERFTSLMSDLRIADTEIDKMLLELERKYGYVFDDD